MKNQRIKSKSKSILYIILFVLLVVYTLLVIVPLLWAFVQSFRDSFDFTQDGPVKFDLSKATFINWNYVFSYFIIEVNHKIYDVGQMFFYTLLFAGGSTIASITATTLMSYAVGRFKYRFSEFLIALCLVVMSLPIVGALPSQLGMVRELNIYDKTISIFILAFTYNGMYFLVLSEAFRAIPKDFSDAASIDGAGRLHIMLRIMLPMVKNIIFTIALLQFVTSWNDYQTPLLFVPSKPTLSCGFFLIDNANPFNNKIQALRELPFKFASSMFVVFPIALLFIFFNKKFLGNISLGGLKE